MGGELLICGGTDWANLGKGPIGKKDKDKSAEAERANLYPNLLMPHRIKNMMGINVRFIAAGSAACHSIIGTEDGKVYTFGRNDKGQLGLGDLTNRNMPTLVTALEGHDVVGAAAGKFHTVFVTKEGLSFSCGSNLQGQCGTGSIKSSKGSEELITNPVQVSLPKPCQKVACGAEFTMWLCEGDVWSAGMPQYGQLGHGTDHEHNTKDSSIKLAYTPQPTPRKIEALDKTTVTNIACGHNHTIVSDEAGLCWSWGNGGYGRLGHKEQKDEFSPRPLETFTTRLRLPKDAVLAAGALTSFCTAVGGQLYAWGKLKVSGDNTMYPKPFLDLAGWEIKSLACGTQTNAAAASADGEEAAITWGKGEYGELGYGPKGKKSSANPDKVPSLDGTPTLHVACGMGHTLFVVASDHADKLPVWENTIEEQPPRVADGGGGRGGKRKAGGEGGKGSKKAK